MLLVMTGVRQGQILDLPNADGARFIIGRTHSAELSLDDDAVARRHATIWVKAGAHHLVEHGSTNGVILNGQLMAREAILADGDRVRMGNTLLGYFYGPDAETRCVAASLRLRTTDPITNLPRAAPPEHVCLHFVEHAELRRLRGLTVADACMAELARRLTGQLAPGETLARVGVDEFALAPGARAAEIARAASDDPFLLTPRDSPLKLTLVARAPTPRAR